MNGNIVFRLPAWRLLRDDTGYRRADATDTELEQKDAACHDVRLLSARSGKPASAARAWPFTCAPERSACG